MLVIRLFRVGKKKQPSFKIVVTDKRKSSTRGRFTEEVGFYNPLTKEKGLKGERIKYWLSKGAKPSDTVYNLLISEKIIEGAKIDVHKKSKEVAAPAPTPSTKAGAETPEKPAEEQKVESAEPVNETKKTEEEPETQKVAEEKVTEETKKETVETSAENKKEELETQKTPEAEPPPA